MMDVVLLAGGFGTRLQSVVKDVPKPMAPVNGKPFLFYLMKYLSAFPVKRFILSIGYKGETIRDFFGSEFAGIPVMYAVEESPLGTGGGIVNALSLADTEEVLILNADTFFKIDVASFLKQHRTHHAAVSLCLRSVPNASRYGTIEREANNRIVAFKEKNGLEQAGTINGGIYLFNTSIRNILQEITVPFSIEKDFFECSLHKLGIYGFVFSDYFIDIGIPSDYQQVQHDFKEFGY
jgi:D-glycero-alpha-D-manno-heptose 1-phosphate guanylyltransferase